MGKRGNPGYLWGIPSLGMDKIVNRGDDITVCLPGAKIDDIVEKAGQVMGGAVLSRACVNEQCREGGNVYHHW